MPPVPQPPRFMALLKQPLADLSNKFFQPRVRARLCSLSWNNSYLLYFCNLAHKYCQLML